MIPFKDIADFPEDDRIRMIGEKVINNRMVVGFMVDDEEGKADRYIRKLQTTFLGIRVMSKTKGPVAGTILVKVGPPVQ